MAFSDFPQQSQAVSLLQRSIALGRLGHAYLFVGNRLGELEEVARTLAKVLNCQGPAARTAEGLALDSCDQCQSCRKIRDEVHPDVHWLRPESKSRVITIDQVREALQLAHLKPAEATCKVVVISAADRLNPQAGNAFLKTLEEPPAQSVLLLLTTEPQRVIETVVSRCLRLTFGGESVDATDPARVAWLRSFAEACVTAKDGLLSRYRLLGLVMEELSRLRKTVEKELEQRSPIERYDELDPGLRERWETELTAAIESEYRRVRAELLGALQWWLRDLWLLGLRVGEPSLTFPQLGDLSRALAGRLVAGDALTNLEVMEQIHRVLGSNVQEALALEVGMLRLRL